MSYNKKRVIGALIFFLWVSFIVATFYVVQKPMLFSAFSGWLDSLWAVLLAAILISNACCIGTEFFRSFKLTQLSSWERLIIGTGLGLGILGITGLIVAALRLPYPIVFAIIQVILILLFWWRKTWGLFLADIRDVFLDWKAIATQTPWQIRIGLGLAFTITFIQAFAPPAEGFDELLYHLVWPVRILEDRAILPYNISP